MHVFYDTQTNKESQTDVGNFYFCCYSQCSGVLSLLQLNELIAECFTPFALWFGVVIYDLLRSGSSHIFIGCAALTWLY